MIAETKGAAVLYGRITRANGKRERKRMLAYYHPNPVRRLIVHALMKLGVF